MGKLFFHTITPAVLDPIFGLTVLFDADKRPDKINLGVGQYRNDQLITPVLESVKLAETFLLREEISKEYLPIAGDSAYLNRVGALVFGEFFWTREGARVSRIQTLGGTGRDFEDWRRLFKAGSGRESRHFRSDMAQPSRGFYEMWHRSQNCTLIMTSECRRWNLTACCSI